MIELFQHVVYYFASVISHLYAICIVYNIITSSQLTKKYLKSVLFIILNKNKALNPKYLHVSIAECAVYKFNKNSTLFF